MASSATLQGEEIPPPQESPPDTACREAQKWIEQVTGKSFGDKDFRTGLENGILLCELLNAIKPGLVKKINRLPTPIAGLDNITLFLRGCKELGLKESQLFDPGDLQDTANRTTARNSDCNRKLRNVLITVYWLGKAASSCSSYSGNNLDLKEFEGLLAQMRKENEEIESPKRSIRDSGYIDCWDSERSDSLSPPRHGRDDSFDSLDSFGSRSQQTPSPDVVLRGSSDGRGSDSESDLPHRRLPDVRKDDMSARRVSYGENKAFVPFNQYLPNKSNQTSYIPAPLRKKKAEREDYRKSWSTATSPLGGERPFSPKQSPVIKEEQNELQCEGEGTKQMIALKEPCLGAENRSERVGESEGGVMGQSSANDDIPKDAEEVRKRKHLQKAGIKVLPATKRYSSPSQFAEDIDGAPDIVLRKENTFLKSYEGMGSDSEEEEECKVPDIQRDDLATRRARMNQPKSPMQFNQYIQGSYLNKNRASRKLNSSKTSTPASPKMSQDIREYQGPQLLKPSHVCKEKTFPIPSDNKEDAEAEQEKVPDIQKDDLAKRKAKASVSLPKEPSAFAAVSITKADMETWQRLRMSSEDSEHLNDRQADQQEQTSKIDVTRATNDDFGRRKLSLQEKRARNKQKFVRFGPVTEIDQQKWDRLCIAKAESGQESEEMKGSITSDETASHISPSASAQRSQPQEDVGTGPVLPHESRSFTPERLVSPAPPENESEIQLLETQQDDMMARRTGTFQKCARTSRDSPVSHQYALHSQQHEEKSDSLELEEKQGLFLDVNPQLRKLLLSDLANTSSKATSPTLGSKSLKVTKEAEDVKNDMKEGALNTGKDPNSVIPEDNTIAPDPEKDDMMTRKISVSQKPSCVSLGHFLPVPFSLQRREGEKKPTSCIISSTKKSKNASKAVPADISDVPSKPLDQKETKEHGELGDTTCKQASNSVETPMCTELDSQQQDGLERRMILSTDLANTELKITPPTLANNSPTITKVQEPDATISEDNTTAPNPEKDDMMTRRISVTQKPSCVGLGHFLPVPFSLQQKVEEKKSTSSTLSIKIKSDNCTQALAVGSSDLPCKLLGQCETEGHVELRSDVTCDQTSTEIISDGIPTGKGLDTQAEDALETCDHELFRFSPRSVLSDDGESMSMCDMRYEEEGSMQPHSRAHYEHLQHVNSLLKEEDDTWQDDLAKWKTRRRSASQDLIKKEEQRKKMERMMSGEDELSERRKSIKTYREIVEEKERREKELHEAYKNAKSRDEAEHILQSYIEKFTISEAVLEGLVMPKILERSQSVEPSLLSSSEDPNILKYLRQQSLPSPKYTSTVEATVSPSSPCEAKSPTGLISPSKNIISKTVPMLTAKPYSQPKNTQEVLKTFKVDGKVNLNGVEEQKEEEHGNQTFAPSLTRSQMFEGVARVDVPVVEIKQDVTSIELNLARPNTLNSLQEPKSLCEDRNHISQEDESDSLVQLERAHSVEILSEGNTQSSNATQDVPVVSSIEIPPLTINGKDTVDERKVEAAELIMHWSLEPNHKEAKENSLSPLKTSENLEESLQFKENVDTECTENSPALVPSLNSPNRFCTWDPEEERKRQEKWQQEQERLLQERYQREQEKLKEEWEKAQKEVEEEERKYYEEERKIIEDTVVPLTLSPNSNAQFNISERNGNFIPALTEHVKRDQENNNEKLLTESSRTIKNETHMHSNVTQQLLLHTQEGSILGAKEKQIKGKTDKWEAEQSICIMDREELSNHVQSNECNTPTRLPLQAGCKQVTSSESSLPGDLGSPKNPITEKDAIQNMSSIIPTRGTDFKEDTMNSSQSSTSQCQSPNRSVSGKKLCSTCGLPLGKGAAMIIETLSLYFHIQCFKCGLCKGQLGDAITGTDVRIRNGLLNCNDCYMKSRSKAAGHPTPL